MTQEEALKVLKDLHETALFSVRNALETFIPELKESEDERTIKDLIESIKIGKRTGITFTDSAAEKFIAWLEKQKEPKPISGNSEKLNNQWSEEDEEKLNWCINLVISQDSLSLEWKKEVLDWLKSLRPQPKQKDRYQEGFQDGVYEGRRRAWEEYNKSVAYHYEDFNHRLSCYEGGPCINPFFDCIGCPRRGNSVVKTYTSPNTTEYQSWKPSEEQMEILGKFNDPVLKSLYNDLKKL